LKHFVREDAKTWYAEKLIPTVALKGQPEEVAVKSIVGR